MAVLCRKAGYPSSSAVIHGRHRLHRSPAACGIKSVKLGTAEARKRPPHDVGTVYVAWIRCTITVARRVADAIRSDPRASPSEKAWAWRILNLYPADSEEEISINYAGETSTSLQQRFVKAGTGAHLNTKNTSPFPRLVQRFRDLGCDVDQGVVFNSAAISEARDEVVESGHSTVTAKDIRQFAGEPLAAVLFKTQIRHGGANAVPTGGKKTHHNVAPQQLAERIKSRGGAPSVEAAKLLPILAAADEYGPPELRAQLEPWVEGLAVAKAAEEITIKEYMSAIGKAGGDALMAKLMAKGGRAAVTAHFTAIGKLGGEAAAGAGVTATVANLMLQGGRAAVDAHWTHISKLGNVAGSVSRGAPWAEAFFIICNFPQQPGEDVKRLLAQELGAPVTSMAQPHQWRPRGCTTAPRVRGRVVWVVRKTDENGRYVKEWKIGADRKAALLTYFQQQVWAEIYPQDLVEALKALGEPRLEGLEQRLYETGLLEQEQGEEQVEGIEYVEDEGMPLEAALDSTCWTSGIAAGCQGGLGAGGAYD